MTVRTSLICGLALAFPVMPGFAAAAEPARDVLNTAAQESPLATSRLLNGAAQAGERLVVVGQRGHVLTSDDNGKTWRQASVPVSSDLVAVDFPSAKKGWAVGHDGAVIASSDGGATWVKQLDGNLAAKLLLEHCKVLAATAANAESSARLVEEAAIFVKEGPDKPFLDVWFENETTGFIVGSFNLMFRTEDGGRTWVPWFDRTDNPERLHLYSIQGIDGDVYATGERGLVLRLDRKSGRFVAIPAPYDGTLFGLVGRAGAIVAFGMRGSAFRSIDRGATWTQIPTGMTAGLNGAALTPQGRIVLAGQRGDVLVSADDGASFAPQKAGTPVPASAVLAIDEHTLLLAGPRGVHSEHLD